MKGLTRWQTGMITPLVTFFLMLAVLLPAGFAGGTAAAAVNVTAEEARMVELVNRARNDAGLPSLYIEQQLTDFARSYSSEMIQYNFFGHVSPVSGTLQQRIAARGITGWTLAGENIAKAPNVDVAFQALMNSASHRANIMRPEFNCIGVGVVRGPDGLYITQEFMRFSNVPSTAERPGTVGVAPPAGSSNAFDTYVLLMNPNDQATAVRVTFQGEDGSNKTFRYTVGAFSRCTIPMRDTAGRGSFAVQVSSDLPVLAERAMYFDFNGKKGGSDSIGTPAPSTTWYFAEGYTGDSFDTWVVLQNPNYATTAATLSFMRQDGQVIIRQVSIGPRQRATVHVDEIPGLEAADVSTRVVSDLPVVAERAMYFNYDGKDGGHASIGTPAPSDTWYFAEGYTGESFDTWVCLLNPNDAPTAATLSFMRSDGQVINRQVFVGAQQRATVHVDEIPGLEAADVSTRVVSDLPVVAERAMYFNYRGRGGGHCTIGASSLKPEWYLPEGYTGEEFDEYVLFLNPHNEAVAVRVVFMRPDGMRVERQITIAPHSRSTIHVDEVEGLQSTEVSTQVNSSLPIVVELAEYFKYRGKCDGNSSVGANQPSTAWYFAEGCVL